jgi:hypothetical protein
MHTSMAHSQPTGVESQASSVRAVSFERTPWLAQERVLEEPRREPEAPLRLEIEEHVIDVPLDGDAILRAG